MELTVEKVHAYTRGQNEAAGLLVLVYVPRDGAAAGTLAAPISPVTHERSPQGPLFLWSEQKENQ